MNMQVKIAWNFVGQEPIPISNRVNFGSGLSGSLVMEEANVNTDVQKAVQFGQNQSTVPPALWGMVGVDEY